MKTIQEEQNSIVNEFEIFDQWLDRYEHLIELSKDLEPLDAKYKTNEYLITGCQSRVWLMAEMKDDRVVYRAETDAIITKGIISLLVRVLSGQKPEDIVNADLFFIDRIGLRENLSPTRSNGLLAMVKQMKLYALAFQTVQKKDEQLKTQVVEALKKIYDPEIPVNIYDLGLIYDIFITKNHSVIVTMTLTAPNCPMADYILMSVQKKVEALEGVKSVTINLVFDPPWSKSLMSDEALLQLGLL